MFKMLKKITRHFNFMLYKKAYGTRFVIPIINNIGFDLLRVQEKDFVKLIEYLLAKKKGCFIDVGANIGQTLLKVRSIDKEIAYYGFEPNLRACFYLTQLIKSNKFNNCTVIPAGASDGMRLLKFYSDGATGQGASFIEGFRSSRFYSSSEDALVVSIDDVMSNSGASLVSVIKIDVEGGELEALLGLGNTIAEYRPFIICEVLPVYDEKSEQGKYRKYRQDTVQKLLEKNNYKIYRIILHGKLQKLGSFRVDSDIEQCNYLFVSEEDEALVGQLED